MLGPHDLDENVGGLTSRLVNDIKRGGILDCENGCQAIQQDHFLPRYCLTC